MEIEKNPKISVVIPCYNYAHYLSECLESVLGQTYKNIEVIVVDDGGQDNAKEICERYPSVIYLRKENGGLASARNAGIEIATGSLISCLDADDKIVPGCIEKHLELMKNDMTIAQCPLMEFGERHVIMVPTFPTSLKRILKSNTIYCNAMFSKRVWEAVGGYDESEIMRWGREDHEFWVRCLAFGCEVNASTEFIALRYRCHEGQMTQATLHPHWGEVEAYMRKKHRNLYEEHGVTLDKAEYVRN